MRLNLIFNTCFFILIYRYKQCSPEHVIFYFKKNLMNSHLLSYHELQTLFKSFHKFEKFNPGKLKIRKTLNVPFLKAITYFILF